MFDQIHYIPFSAQKKKEKRLLALFQVHLIEGTDDQHNCKIMIKKD